MTNTTNTATRITTTMAMRITPQFLFMKFKKGVLGSVDSSMYFCIINVSLILKRKGHAPSVHARMFALFKLAVVVVVVVFVSASPSHEGVPGASLFPHYMFITFFLVDHFHFQTTLCGMKLPPFLVHILAKIARLKSIGMSEYKNK